MFSNVRQLSHHLSKIIIKNLKHHNLNHNSFQSSPWDPVGALRGPVDQTRWTVQRKNLQGNEFILSKHINAKLCFKQVSQSLAEKSLVFWEWPKIWNGAQLCGRLLNTAPRWASCTAAPASRRRRRCTTTRRAGPPSTSSSTSSASAWGSRGLESTRQDSATKVRLIIISSPSCPPCHSRPGYFGISSNLELAAGVESLLSCTSWPSLAHLLLPTIHSSGTLS